MQWGAVASALVEPVRLPVQCMDKYLSVAVMADKVTTMKAAAAVVAQVPLEMVVMAPILQPVPPVPVAVLPVVRVVMTAPAHRGRFPVPVAVQLVMMAVAAATEPMAVSFLPGELCLPALPVPLLSALRLPVAHLLSILPI